MTTAKSAGSAPPRHWSATAFPRRGCKYRTLDSVKVDQRGAPALGKGHRHRGSGVRRPPGLRPVQQKHAPRTQFTGRWTPGGSMGCARGVVDIAPRWRARKAKIGSSLSADPSGS
jgi:hypothetical protein